jgi:hypothetical protein
MKIRIQTTDFKNENRRINFAEFLSYTIQGAEFKIYKPNEDDSYYWTLDSGNNWKVKFFPDELDCVEIIYRYGRHAEEKLIGWLGFKMDLEIIKA